MAQSYGSGFSQGVNTMLKLTNAVRKNRRADKEEADQKEFETIRDNGIDAAKTSRANDIQSGITTESTVNEGAFDQPDQYKVDGNTYTSEEDAQSAQADAQSIATMQGDGKEAAAPDIKETMGSRLELPKWQEKITVDGKEFGSQEEATAASAKNVGSEQDYFMEKAVPFMQEAYMKANKPDQAIQFGKWAQESKNQKKAEEWMGMRKAYSMGKYDVAGDYFKKTFNDAGGEQAKSMTPIMGKEGDFQGYSVVVAGEDGKERTIDYNPDMVESAFAASSPQAMMEYDYKTQTSETKSKVDAAAAAQEIAVKQVQAQQGHDYDIAKDNNATKNKITLAKVKEEIKTLEGSGKVKAFKVDLKAAGLSPKEADEMLKEYLPRVLGVSYASDSFNVQEARSKVVASLAKNPAFSHRSPEEQKTAVDEFMKLVAPDQKQVEDKQLGTPKPARSGLPTPKNKTKPLSRP